MKSNCCITIIQIASGARDPQSLEKDEVLNLIFWFKLIIAFVFGSFAGSMGFTGFTVVVIFSSVNFGLVMIFIMRFLEVDEEKYNSTELMMDGLGNSFGLFILTWTFFYTFL